jgi:hypothetical protein
VPGRHAARCRCLVALFGFCGGPAGAAAGGWRTVLRRTHERAPAEPVTTAAERARHPRRQRACGPPLQALCSC